MNVVALIPARGGSQGIPRKNVRLLNKQPLISYVIKTCLASTKLQGVFVSTEDPEIAEVSRRYGAQVLDRDPSLADEHTTLDEVIAAEIDRIPVPFDYVLTVQPTSPLLSLETLEAFLDKIKPETETLLSVKNETHLAWTTTPDGSAIPLYKERKNRQELPPHFVETGALILAKRELIQTRKTRIGNHVTIVEVPRQEAVDIDDYFDWWIAEKALQRKRICFHVIGNRENGLGHTYRVLTLADRLIDHELTFLVNDEQDLSKELIEKRKYQATCVPKGQEIPFLIHQQFDLVINDILDTSTAYMHALNKAGIQTLNFEDSGDGAMLATKVINALYDTPTADHILTGPAYTCLRDEFFSTTGKELCQEPKHLLLIFGGTDPSNLSSRCLDWLDSLSGKWDITLIIGPGYPHKEELKQQTQTSKHHVSLVTHTPVVSKYMAQADLAITSAGRTVLELASMGVPSIVIAQNERETHHTFSLLSDGIIYLGPAKTLLKEPFLNTVTECLSSFNKRKHMRETLLKHHLSDGIERVLIEINQLLQHDENKPYP